MAEQPYLTVQEAADRLRISCHSLNSYRVRDNKKHLSPPFVKIHGRVLYPLAELDEWVMSHRQAPANAAA